MKYTYYRFYIVFASTFRSKILGKIGNSVQTDQDFFPRVEAIWQVSEIANMKWIILASYV